MNKPVPEKPTLPPDPDDVPMAPSVGQIMEQHMAEIIGPEAAARYRKGKEGAE